MLANCGALARSPAVRDWNSIAGSDRAIWSSLRLRELACFPTVSFAEEILNGEDTNRMFVVAAQYYAKQGKEDEIAAILRKMIPISSAEPGCALYTVNRSVD